MIRKNVANQTVYLPQLRLTADGSAVTAAASLVVAKDGVEAAAAGTLAHYAGGIWKYTPTQAETNCAIMALVLTATGADTVLLNILTTAANPQDATAFGIGNLDGTISSRSSQTSVDTLAGYVDTEVAAIKAKTDNLPIDPADASDIAASFSTVNSTLATISGYIDTEVAAIKAKTDNLPAQPAAVGSAMTLTVAYDAAKTAASQTSVDTLTTYVDTEVAAIKAKTDNLPASPAAVSDIPTANQNRDALLNALPSAGYVNGSFGDRWLISASPQRTVSVTGSNHVAADIHELQPAVITAGDFAAGAIDANALAADAAAEIANAVAATQTLSRLDSMIESDGAGQFRFDTIALSMGAGGGGGTDWTANERTAIRSILGFDSNGTVSLPTVGVMDAIKDKTDLITSDGISVLEDRVNESTITMQYNESTTASVNLDEDTTSATLQFVVSRPDGTDILTIANGSITRTASTFTVTITTAVTATLGQYLWSLRDITGGTNRVVTKGVLTVQNAASA